MEEVIVNLPEHDTDVNGDCPLGLSLPMYTQCKGCPHLFGSHAFHTLLCTNCSCPNFTCPMCGGGVYL